MGETPIKPMALADLRGAFSESRLSFKVDIVDWLKTDPKFQEIIQKKKILIQAETMLPTLVGPLPLLKREVRVKSLSSLLVVMGKIGLEAFSGNYLVAGKDALEVVKEFTIGKDKPEEVAWELILNSLARAIGKLCKDHFVRFQTEPKESTVKSLVGKNFKTKEISLSEDFFDSPQNLPLPQELRPVIEAWLKESNLQKDAIPRFLNRLSDTFALALRKEWLENQDRYQVLQGWMNTPFDNAARSVLSLDLYHRALIEETRGPIPGWHFSILDIFVDLRAYKEKKVDVVLEKEEPHEHKTQELKKTVREVFDLKTALNQWVHSDERTSVRVISGGPGSGKSSLSKIFAAEQAMYGEYHTLWIPLHKLGAQVNLQESLFSITQFDIEIREILSPLLERKNINLLLILDGLDEISMAGREAEDQALIFLSSLDQFLKNSPTGLKRLRVLISGRILAIQKYKLYFHSEHEIWNLLAFLVKNQDEYQDPDHLLKADQREQWWENFSKQQGKEAGIPDLLQNKKLIETSAKPLVNYLFAHIHDEKIDKKKGLDLNQIYERMIEKVWSRHWDQREQSPLMKKLKLEGFRRILELVAVECWKKNWRTTTSSVLEKKLPVRFHNAITEIYREFSEGLFAVLMAFYFRQEKDSPNSDAAFEFTHRSFGEYLVACRIRSHLELTSKKWKEYRDSRDNFDQEADGWDEEKALCEWLKFFGAAPIDRDLFNFIDLEISHSSKSKAGLWRECLCALISYCLRRGMPAHKLTGEEGLEVKSFRDQGVYAQRSEKALLSLLDCCSRRVEKRVKIEALSGRAFINWVLALRSWGEGDEYVYLRCSYLEIEEMKGWLENLSRLQATGASFPKANLFGADLWETNLSEADLSEANLSKANLSEAYLHGANLSDADLQRANLRGAELQEANLRGANLRAGYLWGANLSEACLQGADLSEANLFGVNLSIANLNGAKYLRYAILSDEQESYLIKQGLIKKK